MKKALAMLEDSYLKSPARIASLFLVTIICLVALRWYHGGRDFSYFVVMGDEFVQKERLPMSARILPGPGYDGQFFYRLALNPTTREQTALGISLDRPAYRHQRILYPLLAFCVTLGNARYSMAYIDEHSMVVLCFDLFNVSLYR